MATSYNSLMKKAGSLENSRGTRLFVNAIISTRGW